jgi:hypothetical protein
LRYNQSMRLLLSRFLVLLALWPVTAPARVIQFRIARREAVLAGKRFGVAGVSRQPQQAANAIYRKLCNSEFEVLPSIRMPQRQRACAAIRI